MVKLLFRAVLPEVLLQNTMHCLLNFAALEHHSLHKQEVAQKLEVNFSATVFCESCRTKTSSFMHTVQVLASVFSDWAVMQYSITLASWVPS